MIIFNDHYFIYQLEPSSQRKLYSHDFVSVNLNVSPKGSPARM